MSPAAVAPLVRLSVNGSEREIPSATSIAALVAELAPEARLVAVERNGEIVPRARWAETTLAGGDRVEIVRFVQGG